MKEQSHVEKTVAPIQQPITAQRVSFNDNRPSTSRINTIQQMANNASLPIQLKSKVINQGQNFAWNGNQTKVGHIMKAWLEPGSLVQGESANLNKDQDAMMSAIRNQYGIVGGDLVKGHLLNDNLGGKAMNNNLFPITRAANKQHLVTTENYAKEELWGNQNPIWYTVEVVGTPNINTSQHGFKVSIGSWGGGTNYGAVHPAAVSGTITSNLGSPKDKDEANSEDMETYSAKRLSYAVSHGLALAPKTSVGSLSDEDKNARNQTGNVTNTEHGPDGYTSAS